MESVSGVDVSWLHHQAAQKDKHKGPSKSSSKQSSKTSSRAPSPPPEPQKAVPEPHSQIPPRNVTPPPPSAPIPISSTPSQKSISKRSGMLKRPSSEKLSGSSIGSSPEETKSSSRTGWIRNLSSKFSSQEKSQTLSQTGSTPALQSTAPQPKAPLPSNTLPYPQEGSRPSEEHESHVPQTPKSSGSFFSSALRRLSSSTPNPPSKPVAQGPACPRQLLNIDRKRERCGVANLRESSLRRVAFSVDVEVAGVSRYIEDSEPVEPAQMAKDKKIQARSEGEAFKNPALFAEKKETASSIVHGSVEPRQSSIGSVDELLESEMLAAAKKQEQEATIKRRQAREERRRRRAQEAESGIPLQPTSSLDPKILGTDLDRETSSSHPEDQPTTDPLRIYRRCCQLREAPVLKRISEQLASMKQEVENTGYVSILDLNGSRLQLADIGCLGDWLAVVPLKRLLMDNANLTDEGLRIVLSGLLATRPPDSSKSYPLRPSTPGSHESSPRRRHGVIEKISLRLNHKITAEGWKHICLFLNLSPSLRAIDLSLVPFPHPTSTDYKPGYHSLDVANILLESLSKRSENFPHLEEFVISECHLTTHDVGRVVEGACVAGVSKLGLAKNNIDREGLEHVQRFLASKNCGGLDLGGNDLRENLATLAMAIKGSALWALCLDDCNLDPKALATLFPSLLSLPKFRILVLSHNRGLFNSSPDSVGILRKYLPMCKWLRRLDLTDVALSPQQAIAIADILPEVRNLSHIGLMGNTEIRRLSTASDAVSQEEACALYGSLTVATRLSKTLLVVDIEVPSKDTSEIVQALAKQAVAYAFRNIERYTAVDAINHEDPASIIPDTVEPGKEVPVPEVLEHLLGTADDDGDNANTRNIQADHDYIVGGTGVVKALSYVLGQKSSEIRRVSGHFSGNSSPSHPGTPANEDQKARDMSLSLLNSARKIRGRLQATMAQEANSADELTYRRLQFLDNTLQGMIERFENEFPDSAVPTKKMVLQYPFRAHAAPANDKMASDAPQDADLAEAIDPEPSPPRSRSSSTTSSLPSAGSAVPDPSKVSLAKDHEGTPDLASALHSGSRRGSTASLVAKAQAHEEGRMHRFGQRFRREILPPKGVDDHLHRTSRTDFAEAPHLAELRRRVEAIDSEQLREKVIRNGLESTVREYSEQAEKLRRDSMPVFAGMGDSIQPSSADLPKGDGGREGALSSLEGKKTRRA